MHFQPIPCRLLCGRNIVLPQVFQIEDDVVQNNRFRIGQGFIESHSDPAIFSLTLRSFGNWLGDFIRLGPSLNRLLSIKRPPLCVGQRVVAEPSIIVLQLSLYISVNPASQIVHMCQPSVSGIVHENGRRKVGSVELVENLYVRTIGLGLTKSFRHLTVRMNVQGNIV